MVKSHGMSSKKASDKKKKGHETERRFAKQINGYVCKSSSGKKDVVDRKGITYSVKSGKRSQIFMYSKSRFMENTEFKSFRLTPYFLMTFYKECRQDAMRMLKNELKNDEAIRKTFFSKAFFNANEVDVLVIENSEGEFKQFKRDFVVNRLSELAVENSKGANNKVIFKSNVNVGELEHRSDKNNLLFVFNKDKLLSFLES